ncbi:MAG: type II toxin-antitoxin system VapC family toxin [Deltaproteobacteria bacterium]|nr:type II toxin-antitoxin system VapC family toxin [Deltaproteobacteria bacterium]
MKILLDTHILLWWYLDSPKISTEYLRILEQKEAQEQPIGLSIISLWEISKLVSLGKFKINFSLDQWFFDLEEDPLLQIYPLSAGVILESNRLGNEFPKDPADQLIAATARYHELHLMTVDKLIIQSKMVAVV